MSAEIHLAGTSHRYLGPQITTMHPRVVPDFVRTFENELKNPGTLMIVEGGAHLIGDGTVIYTKKSPERDRIHFETFEIIPPWANHSITVADRRGIHYHAKMHDFVHRIVASKCLCMDSISIQRKKLISSREMFRHAQELLTNGSIAAINAIYSCIDWELLAKEVFRGEKRNVAIEKNRIQKELFNGCNQPILQTIHRWEKSFDHIIVVAGLMHIMELSTEIGVNHRTFTPEVLKGPPMKTLTDEEFIASMLFMEEKFYDIAIHYCD